MLFLSTSSSGSETSFVPGVSSWFQSMCDGRPDKAFLVNNKLVALNNQTDY